MDTILDSVSRYIYVTLPEELAEEFEYNFPLHRDEGDCIESRTPLYGNAIHFVIYVNHYHERPDQTAYLVNLQDTRVVVTFGFAAKYRVLV